MSEADIKFKDSGEYRPESPNYNATEADKLKMEPISSDAPLTQGNQLVSTHHHTKKPTKEMTFSNKDFKKIDLTWEHLNIQALINKKVIDHGKKKTVKETKTILNNISGSVKNGRFTAIMGPSGKYLNSSFAVVVHRLW